FTHTAPAIFPPLIEFFIDNAGAIEAVAKDPMPGLVEPIVRYDLWLSGIPRIDLVAARLRQVGALSRALVRAVGQDGIRPATGRRHPRCPRCRRTTARRHWPTRSRIAPGGPGTSWPTWRSCNARAASTWWWRIGR